MPIALFASGIYEAFAAWNNRQKKYKKISVGKITNSTGIGLAQLGLNFTSIKNAGLIVGRITSYNVCYTKLLRFIKGKAPEVLTFSAGIGYTILK